VIVHLVGLPIGVVAISIGLMVVVVVIIAAVIIVVILTSHAFLGLFNMLLHMLCQVCLLSV